MVHKSKHIRKCRICDEEVKSKGWSSHLRKHNISNGQYIEKYGDDQPKRSELEDDFKCIICGKICRPKGIGTHLRIVHSMTTKEYYDKYIKKPNDGKCIICGIDTNFNSITGGYTKYCSSKCMWMDSSIREKFTNTCIERYGVAHPLSSPEVREKIKSFCLEKYGVENPLSNKQIQDKMRNTMFERYGAKTTLESEYLKDKVKNTCLKKYGVDCIAKSELVRERIVSTNRELYGCDYPLESEEIRDKTRDSYARNVNLGLHFNNSAEDKAYLALTKKFNNVVREYRSADYPFNADFYIPEIDTYIELQLFWTHGGHPFDPSSEDDINIVNLLKNKIENGHKNYEQVLLVWTEVDPHKRTIAKKNNIKLLEFYSEDSFYNWLEL